MSQISATLENVREHFDTIIIGAGISGLACASRLHQSVSKSNNGQEHKIGVLEARDRIGGRIGALYVNGNRLDIGANWIHGIGTEDEPNPLMKILPHKRYRTLSGMAAFRPPKPQEITVTRKSSDEPNKDGWEDISSEVRAQSCDPSEDLVIPSDPSSIMAKALWPMIESLHEKAATMPKIEADRTTMLSAVAKSEEFRNAFKELSPDYHSTLSGLPQFMESMEAAPLTAQSAEHSQDTSGMSLAEFAIEDFDGDQVFLQDGYIAIVNELAKPLIESGIIRNGVKVEEIDWQNERILLDTSSGAYTAKTVVCTLPLGVLKNRQQNSASIPSLFRPSLPLEKTRAISSLGFGTLDKIFMVYAKPWWKEEPFASTLNRGYSGGPFTSQSSGESDATQFREPDSLRGFTLELPGISISETGDVTTGPCLVSAVNLNSLCGFPVLVAFVSCANAAQAESFSDEKAGALIHRCFKSWFGEEPPMPQAVHVTRWAQDPYSFGSYSHMITGLSKIEHREEFHKPLSNKHGAQLRFAGEHTSRNHFATVHGALLSGWREADEVLRTVNS